MKQILTMLLLCFAVACSRPMEPHDIPGAYMGNNSYGTQQLQLNADGSFVQIFESPMESFTNSGRWATHFTNWENRILFNHYREVDNHFGKQAFPSSVVTFSTVIEMSRGMPLIIVNDDIGLCFRKTK